MKEMIVHNAAETMSVAVQLAAAQPLKTIKPLKAVSLNASGRWMNTLHLKTSMMKSAPMSTT